MIVSRKALAKTSGNSSPENSILGGSTVTVTEMDLDSYLSESNVDTESWFYPDTHTNMTPKVSSGSFEPEEDTLEQLPLVSREGLRKMHKHSRGGYQQNRVRKSRDQVSYLRRMYVETGGRVDR